MIERLKQQWQQLQQRFSEQPRERRLLITIAVWVLVTLPLLSYQIMPALEQHHQQQQQLTQVEQQTTQQQQLQSELTQQLQEDVNQPLTKKISRKQQRLQEIEAKTERFTLLDKAERREFLGNALNYPDSISLVSLNSESPVAMGEEQDYASLYQHQVNATYRGNYTDLQQFLAQLRQQHPNVQWHQFNYRVVEYPQAEVVLDWRLLSIDREIIGG